MKWYATSGKSKREYLLISTAIYFIIISIDWVRDYAMYDGLGTVGKITPFLVIITSVGWSVFHNATLVDRFLIKEKYLMYVIIAIPCFVFFVVAHQAFFNAHKIPHSTLWSSFTFLIHTFLSTALYLSVVYMKEGPRFYKLLALNRETELQQLKNQLNPHFLFNALNNVYSYNLENDKKGNDLILKLSQLMRYVVESSKKERVVLQEELDFLSNYIAFEKERLGYRCEITVPREIENDNFEVPPLLFFPLVENALKYGASTNESSTISISVEQKGNVLSVVVRNSMTAKNNTPMNSTHTGINNVKRRLELLFPDAHELIITNGKKQFEAILKISL